MKEIPNAWKFFRVLCYVQLLLLALQLVLSLGGLMTARIFFFSLAASVVYLVLLIFVFMGLSILNNNYPDSPLSAKQKRNFNGLFVLNFLAIAFLFGSVLSEWRNTVPLLKLLQGSLVQRFLFAFSWISAMLIFLFHLVFLWSLVRLRRLIYQNTIETWQEQFE